MSNAQTNPSTLIPESTATSMSTSSSSTTRARPPAAPTPPSLSPPIDGNTKRTSPGSTAHPNPLPTPPGSVRSQTSPTVTSVLLPSSSSSSAPGTAPITRTHSHGSRQSVSFPADLVTPPTSKILASRPTNTLSVFPESANMVDPNTNTPPLTPDELPARKRYHSTVNKTEITSAGKLNRSASSKISSKFQSLRKKIESELSRKRPGGRHEQSQATPGGASKRSSKRPAKGTVAGLRPSPALTVPEGMSVADASQLCAAKRTDCVLVVDDEEGLSGIFTAKDLAFRVTAVGLDPRLTPVSAIMTKNPMVTRDTTSATEALQLMVSRHFRHLPVCNEDGDVVGLLDITKVFHDALAKVERGSSATHQLSAALAGVQTELGPGLVNNPQAAAMLAYVDALRDKMAQPDLLSVLDTSLPPPTVSPRTSVREAARLMKERRTTAVCVLETNTGTSAISGLSNHSVPPRIAGIFTSKDIVLRVIAAGLDASRCSVVRVMTPHPDTAPPTMVVQDALKKMHNGHYLNLPVVEEDGRLMGIVDVLKLTYATLEQIDSMNDDQTTESGPMWSKFFDTLNAAGGDDDSASQLSHSELRTDTPSKEKGHNRGLSSVTSPMSEVMPGDSASAVNEVISDIGTKGNLSSVAPSIPIDDGTYIFKFKTPSGRTHRFQARHDSYELLRDIIYGKLSTDPFFDTPTDPSAVAADPSVFVVNYNDDEGDLVAITADGDVSDAVRIARSHKTDRVVLFLDGGNNWAEAAKSAAPKPVEVPKEIPAAPKPVVEEKVEEKVAEPVAAPAPATIKATKVVGPNGEELLFGVLPKDMALPAAIGFLGVVIAGVFVASRTSK